MLPVPRANLFAKAEPKSKPSKPPSLALTRVIHEGFLDEWPDQDLDTLVERFADLPCHALNQDGSCAVYPFRPTTCRLMGIPVEEYGLVQGACEVQTFVPTSPCPGMRAWRSRPNW